MPVGIIYDCLLSALEFIFEEDKKQNNAIRRNDNGLTFQAGMKSNKICTSSGGLSEDRAPD